MELRYTKLDMLDYHIYTLELDYVDIQIMIQGTTDVIIADIASELTASDGHIYLEGGYYKFTQMRVTPGILHIFAERKQ